MLAKRNLKSFLSTLLAIFVSANRNSLSTATIDLLERKAPNLLALLLSLLLLCHDPQW